MESWVSLGGKEDRTNIQILAEVEIEMGLCVRKEEILPTRPTTPSQFKYMCN